MNKRICLLILIIALAVPIAVAEEWSVPVTCRSGDEVTQLVFGTDSQALSGYDNDVDVLSPAASPDQAKDFCFVIVRSVEIRLSEDYRPVIDYNYPEESWTLKLVTDEPVAIEWNTAEVSGDIAELVLTIEGSSTDMLSVQSVQAPAGTAFATISARHDGLPSAAFVAEPESGPAPLAVHFYDQSIGEPFVWVWNFGDGTTSGDRHPVHTYETSGTYTVSLTVRNSAGEDSLTKNEYISVHEGITAEFIADVTSGTAPLEVAFTDLSTGHPTAWEWDFGDGQTSDSRNPRHTYGSPGRYTVSLTAKNDLTEDTVSKTDYIVVESSLQADFDGDPRSGTAPLDVVFTDLSAGTPTSWEWQFGDGQTSDVQDPAHRYAGPGIYDVSLTVRNGFGSSTIKKSGFITVGDALVADFEADRTGGPAPLEVRFSDRSGGTPTSWFWDFGDTATSTKQSPAHTYKKEGTYTVTLTVTSAFGTATEVKANYITVGTTPSAGFTATPRTGPAPLSVSFTDQSTGSPDSWLWNFGDGTTSTLKNPIHSYSRSGTYSVTLTVANAFGQDTYTQEGYITVGVLPQADFSAAPRTGTPPLEVQFSDLSSGSPVSWTWDFGDGGASNLRNPLHSYARAGSYTVKLTVSNTYGSDSEIKAEYISVGSPPVALFQADTRSGSAPLTVRFSDGSTGAPTAWRWSFGDGALSTARNPTHIYQSAGIFTVTLQVTNAFGSDEEIKSGYITVGEAPAASFAATPTEGLVPVIVRFTDRTTGDPTRWNWDFGDGSTSTEQNPLHQYTGTGTFDVTLTAGNAFGSSSVTVARCITVISGLPIVPGCVRSPTDPDGDGRCEDVNGNGEKDFNDVIVYFRNIDWIEANEPVSYFDFNRNTRIDFADIVLMFRMI
jgi:PKD repeat protein